MEDAIQSETEFPPPPPKLLEDNDEKVKLNGMSMEEIKAMIKDELRAEIRAEVKAELMKSSGRPSSSPPTFKKLPLVPAKETRPLPKLKAERKKDPT